jgi:hypothetical protein
MRRLVLLALLFALGFGSAPARGTPALGDVHLLVVRLTWGPPVASVDEAQAQVAEADDFVRRASFGRASLSSDVTPLVAGFTIPPTCFTGSNADTGLGALSVAARAAAVRLGYDLAAYDRFVYVFPEPVCGLTGLGVGRDVLLANVAGLGALGLVHELGHTFRLPHAGSAKCTTCGIREYGDQVSVMGQGSIGFSAWEKAQLGWLDTVRRVSATGTYVLAPVDEPSTGAQAVLARVTAGTLWIERRTAPGPRVEIRIVRRPPGGGFTRAVFLAGGRSAATVPYLVRVRLTSKGIALTRLDRRG